jgi:NADPH-dependent 2,4-dienoyl-CoA reductase/sulfur reductase-like enzyme
MTDRLVVVGGDAAGMSAAMQVRRRRPDTEVVVLEKGSWTSYSACGIPYLVGGVVEDLDDLVARSPQSFRDDHGVDVRTGHEVRALDLDAGEVEAWDHAEGRSIRLGYDRLHLATGAVPVRPDLPGLDLPFVHGVQTLDDAARLLDRIAAGDHGRVVVVGGGYIGIEMAESFVQRGAEVTLVEGSAQVMPSLDPDIAEPLAAAMVKVGIDVRLGTRVEGVETADGAGSDGAGGVVVAGGERFPADLVVLGLGVRPNSALAADAGIELGVKGAVRTSRTQATSADGVWAAGDCCESFHVVAQRPVHIALGTVANKQGRVAGINLAGGYAAFPGVLGTAVSRVCHTGVGRTGLSSREADAYGFGYVTATVEATSRAGYFPDAKPITLKALAERGSRRLIGAQVIGAEGAAKRIDVLATALWAGMTVDDVVELDLGYAPPFGPVWDPVHIVARQLARQLDGTPA